jgi:hypothetical protein
MNAMTFKRLPRGWTLLVGFVLVLVVVGLTQRWRHRIQLYEDDNRSRESILRHVPRGTPMAQARSTLESGGFDCELSTGLRPANGRASRPFPAHGLTGGAVGAGRLAYGWRGS